MSPSPLEAEPHKTPADQRIFAQTGTQLALIFFFSLGISR